MNIVHNFLGQFDVETDIFKILSYPDRYAFLQVWAIFPLFPVLSISSVVFLELPLHRLS